MFTINMLKLCSIVIVLQEQTQCSKTSYIFNNTLEIDLKSPLLNSELQYENSYLKTDLLHEKSKSSTTKVHRFQNGLKSKFLG